MNGWGVNYAGLRVEELSNLKLTDLDLEIKRFITERRWPRRTFILILLSLLASEINSLKLLC
jgi:integrase